MLRQPRLCKGVRGLCVTTTQLHFYNQYACRHKVSASARKWHEFICRSCERAVRKAVTAEEQSGRKSFWRLSSHWQKLG